MSKQTRWPDEEPDEKAEGRRTILASLLIILAVIGAIVWYLRVPSPEARPLVAQQTGGNQRGATASPQTILVHVTGAVMNPGLYTLTASSHVTDAIQLAGGMLPDANPGSLNPASRLRDGEQIRIPSKTTADSSPAGTASARSTTCDGTGKLNINTAGTADLERLPKIGSATANKILAYREAHGSFVSIEQLAQEKLLYRDSDLNDLRDLLCVE